MSSSLPLTNTLNPNIQPLSVKQLAFISAYLANGFNGVQACKDAGYTCRTENAYAKQAIRQKSHISIEISTKS